MVDSWISLDRVRYVYDIQAIIYRSSSRFVGVEVLTEVVKHLGEQRGLTFPNEKFQLYVDGGVRRATDVLKAVALGATAGTPTFPLVVDSTDLYSYSWNWPAFHLRLLLIRRGGS